MMSLGPEALTETELLAILLRTGCQGLNVMELSHQLLDQFHGLEKLLTTKHHDLMAIKGLGPAKATQFSAILELCRRMLHQKMAQNRRHFQSGFDPQLSATPFSGVGTGGLCLPVSGCPPPGDCSGNVISGNVNHSNGAPEGSGEKSVGAQCGGVNSLP